MTSTASLTETKQRSNLRAYLPQQKARCLLAHFLPPRACMHESCIIQCQSVAFNAGLNRSRSKHEEAFQHCFSPKVWSRTGPTTVRRCNTHDSRTSSCLHPVLLLVRARCRQVFSQKVDDISFQAVFRSDMASAHVPNQSPSRSAGVLPSLETEKTAEDNEKELDLQGAEFCQTEEASNRHKCVSVREQVHPSINLYIYLSVYLSM